MPFASRFKSKVRAVRINDCALCSGTLYSEEKELTIQLKLTFNLRSLLKTILLFLVYLLVTEPVKILSMVFILLMNPVVLNYNCQLVPQRLGQSIHSSQVHIYIDPKSKDTIHGNTTVNIHIR